MMIIQAGNLNYALMQKADTSGRQAFPRTADQAGPGLRLGHAISPAKNGLAPAAPQAREQGVAAGPQTLGRTFSDEIIRRMDLQADETGQVKDPAALNDSLAATMDWVRERFGDETAAAAAGMILQDTSDTVNEDGLGNGLLNTLRFIDRNFGIAAGDEAMARFNSGINEALNDYFDNGSEEIFHAVAAQDGANATRDLNQRFFLQASESAETASQKKDPTLEMLDQFRKELEEKAGLTSLKEDLDQQSDPTRTTTARALAAYSAIPAPEPQLTEAVI